MKCLLTILITCLFSTIASSQIRLSPDSSIYTFTLQIDTIKNLFDPSEVSYIKFKVLNSNYETPIESISYSRKGILRTPIKVGLVFTISGTVYFKASRINNPMVFDSGDKVLRLYFSPIANSEMEIATRN